MDKVHGSSDETAHGARRFARGPMDVVATLARSGRKGVQDQVTVGPASREEWIASWTADGIDRADAEALHVELANAGVVLPDEPSRDDLRCPAAIIGAEAMEKLREARMAVVPFDVPDHAVGEAMTWTDCDDANLVWEALNCAINMIARPDDFDPVAVERLARLGRGELTLAAYKAEGGS